MLKIVQFNGRVKRTPPVCPNRACNPRPIGWCEWEKRRGSDRGGCGAGGGGTDGKMGRQQCRDRRGYCKSESAAYAQEGGDEAAAIQVSRLLARGVSSR